MSRRPPAQAMKPECWTFSKGQSVPYFFTSCFPQSNSFYQICLSSLLHGLPGLPFTWQFPNTALSYNFTCLFQISKMNKVPFKFEIFHWILPIPPYLAKPWLYFKDAENPILYIFQAHLFHACLNHGSWVLGGKKKEHKYVGYDHWWH